MTRSMACHVMARKCTQPRVNQQVCSAIACVFSCFRLCGGPLRLVLRPTVPWTPKNLRIQSRNRAAQISTGRHCVRRPKIAIPCVESANKILTWSVCCILCVEPADKILTWSVCCPEVSACEVLVVFHPMFHLQSCTNCTRPDNLRHHDLPGEESGTMLKRHG